MAHNYEEILQDLSFKFAKQREQNETKRADIMTKQKQLNNLLHNISQNSNAFDEEDKNIVVLEIKANEAEAAQLESDIIKQDAQRKEQETVFKCMELAIQERSKILEGDDACLSAHPNILQFFARKQVTLQMLLASKMKSSVES